MLVKKTLRVIMISWIYDKLIVFKFCCPPPKENPKNPGNTTAAPSRNSIAPMSTIIDFMIPSSPVCIFMYTCVAP